MRGPFENLEFCAEHSAYCAEFGIDPAEYFDIDHEEENHLLWSVRRTINRQAARWREENQPNPRPDEPPVRTSEQIREHARQQDELFEMVERGGEGGAGDR